MRPALSVSREQQLTSQIRVVRRIFNAFSDTVILRKRIIPLESFNTS